MGLHLGGLLSEGYLLLRFGGLIFGRAYLFIFSWGGGGGLLWYITIVMFLYDESPVRLFRTMLKVST